MLEAEVVKFIIFDIDVQDMAALTSIEL